ncbi:hypothetical protein B0H17DRAFT_1143026 [Mycena rosella]|uniref:Uncharacterized protein n=1 Tax=Mycena rosella TaxID=1033263 RepID=A0AAD7CWI1_MYCRO|nr:hypothetical protein B0H17DRAFT_1143026 [Mycena rosella]
MFTERGPILRDGSSVVEQIGSKCCACAAAAYRQKTQQNDKWQGTWAFWRLSGGAAAIAGLDRQPARYAWPFRPCGPPIFVGPARAGNVERDGVYSVPLPPSTASRRGVSVTQAVLVPLKTDAEYLGFNPLRGPDLLVAELQRLTEDKRDKLSDVPGWRRSFQPSAWFESHRYRYRGLLQPRSSTNLLCAEGRQGNQNDRDILVSRHPIFAPFPRQRARFLCSPQLTPPMMSVPIAYTRRGPRKVGSAQIFNSEYEHGGKEQAVAKSPVPNDRQGIGHKERQGQELQ